MPRIAYSRPIDVIGHLETVAPQHIYIHNSPRVFQVSLALIGLVGVVVNVANGN